MSYGKIPVAGPLAEQIANLHPDAVKRLFVFLAWWENERRALVELHSDPDPAVQTAALVIALVGQLKEQAEHAGRLERQIIELHDELASWAGGRLPVASQPSPELRALLDQVAAQLDKPEGSQE